MTWWVLVQKIYSKMHSVLCTNTHHDVTDLVNHGMVKNTKTWISWKQNLISLRNKKTLDLCLRLHILRSYSFLAEVTFNSKLETEQLSQKYIRWKFTVSYSNCTVSENINTCNFGEPDSSFELKAYNWKRYIKHDPTKTTKWLLYNLNKHKIFYYLPLTGIRNWS